MGGNLPELDSHLPYTVLIFFTLFVSDDDNPFVKTEKRKTGLN